MKRKVVVTGGGGFIGSHVVNSLAHEGFDVHVIDTFVAGRRPDRLNSSASYHEIDIRDLGGLLSVFQNAEYVFHLAALPRVQFSIENPIESFEVNAKGTLNVLQAAHTAGVKRVVYAASSAAYGDQDTLPLEESMSAEPKSPYGLEKYLGELMCRTWHEVYGLETVSLRYFNAYGPGLDPDGAYALVVGRFLKQHKAGEPLSITGDGTQTRDFVHVRDIAQANILAMNSRNVGNGEVLNIGSGISTSINELAALFGDPVTYIAPRLEPHDSCSNIYRAKELLDWTPTISLQEGVKELLDLQ